jgi:flagellar biosynthetic protein FliP
MRKHEPARIESPRSLCRTLARCWLGLVVILFAMSGMLTAAWAQAPDELDLQIPANFAGELGADGDTREMPDATQEFTKFVSGGPDAWTSREGLRSSLQIMLLLTVLSMAPAILLMTTSFVRIIVVMGLLRQALGTQQLPPSQVVTSIALFMTMLVMWPTWSEVYNDSIKPYSDPDVEMSLEQAWNAGVKPIRAFMSRQIDIAGNSDDVWLFYEYLPPETPNPETYDDIPLVVLLPAYMLSELKTAFLIGFQIYLPFLVLDLVVASVTISMGMMMLPPVMISLPLKLILFVLVDGWRLVVGMLLESFAPYG